MILAGAMKTVQGKWTGGIHSARSVFRRRFASTIPSRDLPSLGRQYGIPASKSGDARRLAKEIVQGVLADPAE